MKISRFKIKEVQKQQIIKDFSIVILINNKLSNILIETIVLQIELIYNFENI